MKGSTDVTFSGESTKVFKFPTRNLSPSSIQKLSWKLRVLSLEPSNSKGNFIYSSFLADKKINRSLQKVGTYSKGLSGSRGWFLSLSLSRSSLMADNGMKA